MIKFADTKTIKSDQDELSGDISPRPISSCFCHFCGEGTATDWIQGAFDKSFKTGFSSSIIALDVGISMLRIQFEGMRRQRWQWVWCKRMCGEQKQIVFRGNISCIILIWREFCWIHPIIKEDKLVEEIFYENPWMKHPGCIILHKICLRILSHWLLD